MTIQERIASDRAKYKLQQNQQRNEELRCELTQEHPADEPRDERVKTNIDPKRAQIIGEVFVRHFPELQGFHPMLNESANASEFKQLDEFFSALASFKSCYDALQAILNDKETTSGPVNSKSKQ